MQKQIDERINEEEKKRDTDTQEDRLIRGSNFFKCCLEEIPMMNPKLRLPQQGTLSPHVCPHAAYCFPETLVLM